MTTFREHMVRWIDMFDDRGTVYMRDLLQDMVDEGRDTQADLEAELERWLQVKKTTRIYGTRHSEAWAKSDMLKEVLAWYGKEY